jgi:hypothetical protein
VISVQEIRKGKGKKKEREERKNTLSVEYRHA